MGTLVYACFLSFIILAPLTTGQVAFRSQFRTLPTSTGRDPDTEATFLVDDSVPTLPGASSQNITLSTIQDHGPVVETSNSSAGKNGSQPDRGRGNVTIPLLNTTHVSAGDALVSEAANVVAARTQIQACLLMETGTNLWYDYDKSAAAVDLAIDYANEQILKEVGFHLITTYRNTANNVCTEKNHAVTYAMNLIDKGINCDVFIGGGCAYNYQSLYDVADFLNIPFIGLPAAGVGADADITLYTNLARVSVTHLNTANVIVRFFQAFNYTTPTVYQDLDNAVNQQLSLIVESYIENNFHSLHETSNFQEIHARTLTQEQISDYLKEGITTSRVFLLITNASSTRQFMLAARDIGLINGDYVFLAIEMFASTAWGAFTWHFNDTYDGAARDAYQALLIISLEACVDTTFEVFESAVKTASAAKKKHGYVYGPDERVDLITSHFYDSIIFYASIMRDMWRNGTDIFKIDNFIAWASGYSFQSPVHGTVKMDKNADRISAYTISALNPGGQFQAVFAAPPGVKGLVPLGQLRWVSKDTLPANSPRCGFDGKAAICAPKPTPKSVLAVAAVIPSLLVLAAIIAAYVVFKKFLNKNKDPYWWRVFMHELSMVQQGAGSKAGSQFVSRVGSTFQSKKSVDDDSSSTKAAELQDDSKLAFVMFTKSAQFRGNTVAIRELPHPLQRITHGLTDDLLPLKTAQHTNLLPFYGIAVNDENLCEYALGEVCPKGSLQALIERKSMNLDWEFKYSIMKGVAAGMSYLHTTKIFSHGDLSSHTVLIDSRFVVKVTDYGMNYFRPMDDMTPPDEEDEDRDFSCLLWRAPELLRRPILGGTQKGDVYSFGVILQQLILRSAPYESSLDSQRSDYLAHARDLVMEVKKGAHPPQRPRVPISACPIVALHEMMESCWEEHPETRPPFQRVRELLQKYLGKSGENVIEHLITRMDHYAGELEHEAEDKMKMFMLEKERSEQLLAGMLPKVVSERLRKGDMIYPEVFESSTVQFSDISGFAEILAAAPSAYITIDIMNQLYTVCDHVIEQFDVYKVETVRDCYLLVSGVPSKNGIKHAGIMAELALTMRKDVGQLTFPSSPDAKLRLRVGINSGSCVASVVGLKMPKYCLFGDTVNTASRMESHGEAGKIQVSPSTKELLDKLGDFFVASRGEITVKGKGLMKTFWLIAKTSIH